MDIVVFSDRDGTINKDENSEISSRAGRAPYYLIFNEKEELLETLSNPFTIGGGGVGIAIAKMLADKDVEIIIAGATGSNITNALDAKGIKFYEKHGRAKEALREVL